MRPGMGPQQLRIRDRGRLGPSEREALLRAEQLRGAADARRLLWMAHAAVTGAARIGDDGHPRLVGERGGEANLFAHRCSVGG